MHIILRARILYYYAYYGTIDSFYVPTYYSSSVIQTDTHGVCIHVRARTRVRIQQLN